MSKADKNDVLQTQSPESLIHPVKPLQSDIQELESLVKLFTSKEKVEKTYQEIMELPPEERFTESYKILKDKIEKKVDSPDRLKILFSNVDEDELVHTIVNMIHNKIRDNQQKVLQGVYFKRDADDHLIIAVLLEKLIMSFEMFRENKDVFDKEENQIAISCALALGGRLYNLVEEVDKDIDNEDIEERTDIDDEILLDIERADYYISRLTHEVPEKKPEERDIEEIRQDNIQIGSAIAYSMLDITVSRGAELAGMSEKEFKKLLKELDIKPRYGPKSVEELNEDSDK